MTFNSPLTILNETFGYDQFRDQQAEIIDCLVAGHDALVLMPTGGGKSLCYQIPALIRPGIGIVISPLIALMQDQVDALTELGIRAAYLNSSVSMERQRDIQSDLRSGHIDLLYIAPERLVLMQSTLKKRRVLPPPRTAVIMSVSQLHGLGTARGRRRE